MRNDMVEQIIAQGLTNKVRSLTNPAVTGHEKLCYCGHPKLWVLDLTPLALRLPTKLAHIPRDRVFRRYGCDKSIRSSRVELL